MKEILIFIFLFNFSLSIKAQSAFQKTFYGMDLFYCITKPTADGGYILTGRQLSLNNDEDAFLIKLDINGDTMWTKSYVLTGFDNGNDVIQTNDGGFLVVTGRYLLKTDSVGVPLWAKRIFSWIFDASHFAAVESYNGDLTIAGTVLVASGVPGQFLITKLDSAGNLVFTKSFGNFNGSSPRSIQITNDNGYIIAGQTDFNNPNNDGVLIKTDSMGNISWVHTYGSNIADAFYYAVATNDGGYMAIGFTTPNNDMLVVKTDSLGNLNWAKTYQVNPVSTNTKGFMLHKTSDNNFVFCGESYTSDHMALIGKLDSSGSVLWAKGYKPGILSGGSGFNSICETSDFGLVFSGYYIEQPWDGYLYIVKSDSSGNSNCFSTNFSMTAIPMQSKDSISFFTTTNSNIANVSVSVECFCDSSNTICIGVGFNEIFQSPLLKAFPNPFSDKLNFTINNNEPSEIIIYDMAQENYCSRNLQTLLH